jgi:hypothetical protein
MLYNKIIVWTAVGKDLTRTVGEISIKHPIKMRISSIYSKENLVYVDWVDVYNKDLLETEVFGGNVIFKFK